MTIERDTRTTTLEVRTFLKSFAKGRALLDEEGSLDPVTRRENFIALCTRWGLNGSFLACALNRNLSTIRDYRSGWKEIPPEISAVLRYKMDALTEDGLSRPNRHK